MTWLLLSPTPLSHFFNFSPCSINILTCFGVFHLKQTSKQPLDSTPCFRHRPNTGSYSQQSIFWDAVFTPSPFPHFLFTLSSSNETLTTTLHQSSSSLVIRDLHMRNPNVNSHSPLLPHITASLNTGDDILLGKTFLYCFPSVSHFMGSSSSVFFAGSFLYTWHWNICYKQSLLWALFFSQDAYSLSFILISIIVLNVI